MAFQQTAGNAAVARLLSGEQRIGRGGASGPVEPVSGTERLFGWQRGLVVARAMSEPSRIEPEPEGTFPRLYVSFDSATNEVQFGGGSEYNYCRHRLGFVPPQYIVPVNRLPPDVVADVGAAFPEVSTLGGAVELGDDVYVHFNSTTGQVEYSGAQARPYLEERLGLVPPQLTVSLAVLPAAMRDGLRERYGGILAGEFEATSQQAEAPTGDLVLDQLRASRRDLHNARLTWTEQRQTLYADGQAGAARLVDACVEVIGHLRGFVAAEIAGNLEEIFSGSLGESAAWAVGSTALATVMPPGFGLVAGIGISVLGSELGRSDWSRQVREARGNLGPLVRNADSGDAVIAREYFRAHATFLDDILSKIYRIDGMFSAPFAGQIAGMGRTEEILTRETAPEEDVNYALDASREADQTLAQYEQLRGEAADLIAGIDTRVASVRAAARRVTGAVWNRYLFGSSGRTTVVFVGDIEVHHGRRLRIWGVRMSAPRGLSEQMQSRISSKTWDGFRQIGAAARMTLTHVGPARHGYRRARSGRTRMTLYQEADGRRGIETVDRGLYREVLGLSGPDQPTADQIRGIHSAIWDIVGERPIALGGGNVYIEVPEAFSIPLPSAEASVEPSSQPESELPRSEPESEFAW